MRRVPSLLLVLLALGGCFALSAGESRAAMPGCASTPGACTDHDLKKQVLAETPGLARAVARGRTERVAVLVLRWAAPRIVLPAGTSTRTSTDGRSASDIYYRSFAPKLAGAFCYEAADFYSKLLTLFGVTSHMVLHGQSDGYQHAVVLVRINGKYALFDPTFNGELRSRRTGKLAPIGSVLGHWRSSDPGRLTLRTADLSDRVRLTQGPGGKLRQKRCRGAPRTATGCSLDRFMDSVAADLSADGFCTGFNGYLQMFAVGEWFGPDHWGVPDFLIQAQSALHKDWVGPAPKVSCVRVESQAAGRIGLRFRLSEPAAVSVRVAGPDHVQAQHQYAAGRTRWALPERLSPGAYTLDIGAVDADGNKGSVRHLKFQVRG